MKTFRDTFTPVIGSLYATRSGQVFIPIEKIFYPKPNDENAYFWLIRFPDGFEMGAAPEEVENTQALDSAKVFNYEYFETEIKNIIGLVQDNPKFFHADSGDSSIRLARETLERLIKNHKIYLDKNPYME